MKILLFGKTGQLGRELQRALGVLGEVIAPGRNHADFEDLSGLRAVVRNARPAIVVNAAAYTAVDQAETEPQRAERVNVEAVQVIAEESARCGAWLVLYSTDYVFDGTQTRPYREDDPVGPLSVYGRTKLAGEQAVRAHHGRHLIFRTSWLFSAHRRNFPKTILRLAREGEELSVVADQRGAPTSAAFVAEVTAIALTRIHNGGRGDTPAGTYHVAAAGETTWYDYACFVLAQARDHGFTLKAGPDRLRPTTTADYPLPAARPANSRLDTSKLEATFAVRPPDWRSHVARLVTELAARENA